VQVIAGLLAMVLTASLVVVFIEYGRGYYDGGYEVSAVFPSSSQGLFTDGGSDVKVRGLNVGTVSGIDLLEDGRARITLKLNDGVRLPDTAVASIEPLSVFGPKFVRIDPGAHEHDGPFLRPGDVITDTHTAVELVDTLDNASNLLSHVNPTDLAAILTAVAQSVDGMGAEIGSSIDDTGALVAIGASHAADIETFLTDVARIVGVVSDHADDIVATVDDLDALLPTFTAHADDVGHLLEVTDRISSTFAGLLQQHSTDIDSVIRTLAGFVDGVYDEAARIPDIIDLVGTFFGRLADVIRFPTAEQKQMAALRGFIAIDLCLIFDVCVGR
jgi:phospholipid/cholesterol/gamma-HCH transport system substrate-binding protein